MEGIQAMRILPVLLFGILLIQDVQSITVVNASASVGDESVVLSCGQLQNNIKNVSWFFSPRFRSEKPILRYQYTKSNEHLWFADKPKPKYTSNGSYLVVYGIEIADAGTYRFCQILLDREVDCYVDLNVIVPEAKQVSSTSDPITTKAPAKIPNLLSSSTVSPTNIVTREIKMADTSDDLTLVFVGIGIGVGVAAVLMIVLLLVVIIVKKRLGNDKGNNGDQSNPGRYAGLQRTNQLDHLYTHMMADPDNGNSDEGNRIVSGEGSSAAYQSIREDPRVTSGYLVPVSSHNSGYLVPVSQPAHNSGYLEPVSQGTPNPENHGHQDRDGKYEKLKKTEVPTNSPPPYTSLQNGSKLNNNHIGVMKDLKDVLDKAVPLG